MRPDATSLTLATNSSYSDSRLNTRGRVLLGSQQSSRHGSTPAQNTADSSLALAPANMPTNNGSLVDDLTEAFIKTGTSRWPAAYTAKELQLSIGVLFVAVAVASCLQLVVIGLWKLLKLNPNDKPK